MPDANELRTSLSGLVLSDPRRARVELLNLIDNDIELTDRLLRTIASQEYARLRSLVANIARAHPQKQRLVPFLLAWRDAETDEFSRRAIYSALADVDERSYTKSVGAGQALPPQTVELYQYVSDRLKHRLRNSMLAAQAYTMQLRTALEMTNSVDVRAVAAKLDDAMLTMARTLEATDADPAFFKLRPIAIVEWLKQMNGRYASIYPAIRFSVDNRGTTLPRVIGSDYLLETVFWNIWTNAHQAIGQYCEISVSIWRANGSVHVSIVDNGEGFSEDLVGVAFSQQYSTNSPQRGRGLLEVSDAVTRMRGSVELFQYSAADYRIKLVLPEHRS